MTSGRALEDPLLAAAISTQQAAADGEWDVRELVDALEDLLGTDVKPFTVQRNIRRWVGYGWVTERATPLPGGGRRKRYRLEPAGLLVAQRAAARLVGAGADWALVPLGLTFPEP